MRRFLPLTLMLLLLLAPLPAAASGRDGAGVSGRISWLLGDYHADGEGGATTDASSFAQHYSLLYRNSGYLNGGRGGMYTYLLGGEFTGINNRINGVDDALSTYKPLYNGQLLIAPGGLPFRLKLFCADTHVTTLLEDSNLAFSENRLFTPGIATDFTNGKHRELGATLALGIKNGSYLGNYRETLAQWPRLLMDYRELEVESFRSKTPQNYRQRNLAFVSLNKKDNWFHYRFTDYRDFLNKSGANDYEVKSYILGTIDPVLSRAWINLTNWIKLSADGSFTQDKGNLPDEIKPTETYATNLFAVVARQDVRANVFSSFWRERTDAGLNRTFSLPVNVQQRVNRATSWQLNAALDRSRDEQQIVPEFNDIFYLGLRVDTRQDRPYMVSPQAKVELFEGFGGDGSALEAGVELASNPERQSRSENRLSFLLRRFSGEERTGKGVDYLEHELKLSHAQRHQSWRLGAEETLRFGNGTYFTGFGHRIVPMTASGQTYSNSTVLVRDGATLQSVSRFYGETGVGSNLLNRLELLFDYLSSDLRNNLQWSITHSLEATPSRALRYTMTNMAIFGEGQEAASNGAIAGGELAVSQTAAEDRSFSHSSVLNYAPTRSVNLGGSLELKSQDGSMSSLHYLGKQYGQYTYFRINGVIRPLFDLYEELTYEALGSQSSMTTLTLKGNYYPTSHVNLGLMTTYSVAESGAQEEETMTGSLWAGLIYPKFSVRLNYNQGVRTSELGERQESGFHAQIDKTF